LTNLGGSILSCKIIACTTTSVKFFIMPSQLILQVSDIASFDWKLRHI
jgi:hypothetical protein